MKKRSNVAKIMDSISAIIDTVLLALVPIVFCYSIPFQVFAYVVLLGLQLTYICFLRKKIIDKIVSPKGVDTDLILATNCADKVRGKILSQVHEIQASAETSAFDEYVDFLKWQESSTFITQHFWKDKLINVVLEENVRYSKNKIYKKELLLIVKTLIDVYKRYNQFALSIDLYACKTLAYEIQEIYAKLEKIENNLKNEQGQ